MTLRKAAPGEGAKKARTHFGYVSTTPGKSWFGWIAGPCYWCVCHTAGASKPCLDWMTRGEIACPRCAQPKPPEEIGYQPLYRDVDGRPVMVIVHNYSREQVDALKFRQFVTVARGTDSADPVMVSGVPGKQTWYHSTLPERQQHADLTETLLRVWGIQELCAWHAQQSDTALSLTPGVAVKDDGHPYSPEMQAAARRAGAEVTTDQQAVAEYDAIIDRLKQKFPPPQPSGNGKHKPKG